MSEVRNARPADRRGTPYKKKWKIRQLKAKLAETDYIAAKIAEGSATAKEYADKIAERQSWRAEINELEELTA